MQLKKFLSHFKVSHKHRITPLDITILLRQLATLFSAGIPIIKCCDILEKSQNKTSMRVLMHSIKRELYAGKNLYSCLHQHPHLFDELSCQLIQIGEHTGKLDTLLSTLATHHEKHFALRNKIKQSLFYPCVISITAFIMTVSMFIFVIPRFAELFHDMQDKLPTMTIWIFYISEKMRQYGVIFIFIMCLSSIALTKSSFKLKQLSQQILRKLPIGKRYIDKVTLIRFARNLSITFSSGLPIIDALKISINNNHEFAAILTQLRSKIAAGMSLHHIMATIPFFPLLMIQMVKIGEETGMLDHMLDKCADMLEADINQLINQITQLAEPLIMVILGVLIGGLVIGMYLPIFKLGSAI